MSVLTRAIAPTRTKPRFVRLPVLAVALVLLALFGALTAYAAAHTYMPFDVPVERWIQSLPWGPLVAVFTAFDWLEGVKQYYAGIGVILLITAFNWKNFPLVAIAASSVFIYTFVELTIRRPRPSADLVNVIRHTGSFSFPSGHVVFFSWVIVLLIVCLGYRRLSRPLLTAAWVIGGLALLIACVGRIYLGEHWPSDVLGGLALSLGWTALALSIRLLSNHSLEHSR